jgi:hypothetical protein
VIFCSRTLQSPSFSGLFGTRTFFVIHCVVVKGMGGNPRHTFRLDLHRVLPHAFRHVNRPDRSEDKKTAPQSIAPRAKPQCIVFMTSCFAVPLKKLGDNNTVCL